MPRDHEQSDDFGETGDQVLRQAVGKEFLLRVAAHVGERQHSDRGPIGERKRWPAAVLDGRRLDRRLAAANLGDQRLGCCIRLGSKLAFEQCGQIVEIEPVQMK